MHLAHLVLSEHLQSRKDFGLQVGKSFSSENGLAQSVKQYIRKRLIFFKASFVALKAQMGFKKRQGQGMQYTIQKRIKHFKSKWQSQERIRNYIQTK